MTTPVYDSVAYLASDRFAVFNAAGESFASEFAPGLRLRADCGTDGVLLGTVVTASFDAATGRTVVTTAMDDGAALTANLAGLLHGNDLPESLCAHAALHAPGGRDALATASTGVSGLVALASQDETQAGANAAKAVTPAGLAASAKGLIAANTTLYVATTGNDTTGTGASSSPYATIAKALSSIAGKLIASGVTVTIQVADGTYTVSGTITVDHPDADKIQILGNTAAETTVAIATINTTVKTFTVAGNYVSNADATKNIQNGDIIGVAGSSTSGLNGAYLVSGLNYDGTNTIITCAAETIASSAVGGGVIVIKPCNKCTLSVTTAIRCILVKSKILNIQGFKVEYSSGLGAQAIVFDTFSFGKITSCILHRGGFGLTAQYRSLVTAANISVKSSATYGFFASIATIFIANNTGVSTTDGCGTGIFANSNSFVFTNAPYYATRNCTTAHSPALNTSGNGNSYIQQ